MKVFSVSELTRGIRSLLEDNFSDLWIEGEISNFKPASSGHFYFSLKDENAQIRAVMFRGANGRLRFQPENGLQVLGYGRVSVYEPRGEYQIILEHLEPKGLGALQLAFEQLKKKLEAEGLFDPERKRPIPFLPRKIGIVTSPTGAVVRDMIHVLTRRFPNVQILIHPVLVQGEGAAEEIAAAVREMGARDDLDVLIVGRGGGSMEDLWAFNEEVVARAIAASRIPVISAVGHETDFTIADFVADLRAPTPSAAAELAVPVKEDLLESLGETGRRLRQIMGRMIENLALHLDHARERAGAVVGYQVGLARERLRGIQRHLDSLNPLAILERGYAIVTPKGSSCPLRRASEVSPGDALKIRLYEGEVSAIASARNEPAKS